MPFANEETLNNTIEECRLRLHQLMNVQPPTSNENATSPSTKNLSPNNMFKELIFGSAQRSQEFTDELDFYLDLRRTPVAFPDIDPLLWWRQHQVQFPFLSKLAKKYLGVPATSAPSERIFSNAGNHITPRHSNLKPKLVS